MLIGYLYYSSFCLAVYLLKLHTMVKPTEFLDHLLDTLNGEYTEKYLDVRLFCCYMKIILWTQALCISIPMDHFTDTGTDPEDLHDLGVRLQPLLLRLRDIMRTIENLVVSLGMEVTKNPDMQCLQITHEKAINMLNDVYTHVKVLDGAELNRSTVTGQHN